MAARNGFLEVHHQQILRKGGVGLGGVSTFQRVPDVHQGVGIARPFGHDAPCAETPILIQPAVAPPGAEHGLDLRRRSFRQHSGIRVLAAGLFLDPAIDIGEFAGQARQQRGLGYGHLLRSVGLDDHRTLRNPRQCAIVARDVVLRAGIVRRTRGDCDRRRRMLNRERFHMARQVFHIGGVAALAPQHHHRILALKRLCERVEARFALIGRQQVDRIVGLRPDEAVHAAPSDKLRLRDQRPHIQRTVRVVRDRKDGIRPAQTRRRRLHGKNRQAKQSGRQDNCLVYSPHVLNYSISHPA